MVGPAYKLKSLFQDVSEGHLRVYGKLRQGDELWDVFVEFEKMINKLRQGQRDEIAQLQGIIERAKETLILERRTHIDSLLARLREERVLRVLDPMIAGGTTRDEVLDDDFAYVAGLGLIRKIDGPIAMLPCVSLYFYERCKNCDEENCGLHDTMILVRDATLKILEKKTVADLANMT